MEQPRQYDIASGVSREIRDIKQASVLWYTDMVPNSSYVPKISVSLVYWDGWRSQHFIFNGVAITWTSSSSCSCSC